MRNLSIPTLLCTLLLFMLAAGSAQAGHWPLEIYDVMDGKKIVVFLQDDDITASPQWLPTDGPPPLTVADALQKLHAWMGKDSRLKGAWFHEMELKPIHGHEQEHRWYYLMQMQVEGGKPKYRYAVVLFNGKVVPAMVEPASYK